MSGKSHSLNLEFSEWDSNETQNGKRKEWWKKMTKEKTSASIVIGITWEDGGWKRNCIDLGTQRWEAIVSRRWIIRWYCMILDRSYYNIRKGIINDDCLTYNSKCVVTFALQISLKTELSFCTEKWIHYQSFFLRAIIPSPQRRTACPTRITDS